MHILLKTRVSSNNDFPCGCGKCKGKLLIQEYKEKKHEEDEKRWKFDFLLRELVNHL